MNSMNVMNVMNVLQGHQGGNSNFFPVYPCTTFMTFITFMGSFWWCFGGLARDLGLVSAVKVCTAGMGSQNVYTFS